MTLNNRDTEQANDFGSLFQELKRDLLCYVDNRVTHYRLDILERISKAFSSVTLVLLTTFLGFSAFSFALMALAYFLGEVLGSTAAGFGVVALLWIILLAIVIALRKPIKDNILNRAVKVLHKIEKEDIDNEG